MSKSQVALRADDARVQAFLNRPLKGDRPFPGLDAPCVKRREDGRIVSMAVMVAVDTDGRREILGIAVLPSGAATVRADVRRSVARRGRRGVQLVVGVHEGLEAAARKVPGGSAAACISSAPCRRARAGPASRW